MVRDSVWVMTSDVLKPIDLNINGGTPVGHQLQFVPFNTAFGEDQSYGFGGTSLCATNNTAQEGAAFYVVVGSLHPSTQTSSSANSLKNVNAAGIKGSGIPFAGRSYILCPSRRDRLTF
jgi:hypothetical protein